IDHRADSKEDRWKDSGKKQDRADQALSGRFVQEESCFAEGGHDPLVYQILSMQIKLGWAAALEKFYLSRF
ncbi:MAG: hypothetical protein ACK48K_07065, partial [Planctomycetota bacterium]